MNINIRQIYGSTLVIVTIALAAGAAISVLSVATAVLTKPLPFPDAERLVQIYEERRGGTDAVVADRISGFSADVLRRATKRSWSAFAIYDATERTVRVGSDAFVTNCVSVSEDFFSTLGVKPFAGDLLGGVADVNPAVIGYALWRDRLGADVNVIGRQMVIDNRTLVIVGVAPPSFRFPDESSAVWMRLQDRQRSGGAAPQAVFAIGRLQPTISVHQASDEATDIVRRAGPASDSDDILFGSGRLSLIRVEPLADHMTARARQPLVLLSVGVLVLLCSSAASIVSLLIAVAIRRQRATMIQVALGATPRRIAQALFTEALVIGVIGCTLAAVVAVVTTGALRSVVGNTLPRVSEIAVDRFVAVVVLGCLLVLVSIANVWPALRDVRFGGLAGLRESTRGTASAMKQPAKSSIYSMLLILEVTLATCLLVCAVLLGRSFTAMMAVDLGYEPKDVVTVHVPMQAMSLARKQDVARELIDALRRNPRIAAVGGGNMMPFGDSIYVSEFDIGVRQTGGKPNRVKAIQYIVTLGYADALRLRLREGRYFSASDEGAPVAAALVNREFVRKHLSADPVVGRVFSDGFGSSARPTEIVGVVADVLKDGIGQERQPEIYLLASFAAPGRASAGPFFTRELNIVLRTRMPTAQVAAELRAKMREIAPEVVADRIVPLEDSFVDSVRQPMIASIVIGIFAAVSLLLCVIGVYGTTAQLVTARQRDLGIRVSLGATSWDVAMFVIVHGARPAVIGLAIGIICCLPIVGSLRSLLFGIAPADMASFVTAAIGVLIATLAACVGPVVRAVRVDPVDALKSG